MIGRVLSGMLQLGAQVILQPCGFVSTVESIQVWGKQVSCAGMLMLVSLLQSHEPPFSKEIVIVSLRPYLIALTFLQAAGESVGLILKDQIKPAEHEYDKHLRRSGVRVVPGSGEVLKGQLIGSLNDRPPRRVYDFVALVQFSRRLVPSYVIDTHIRRCQV